MAHPGSKTPLPAMSGPVELAFAQINGEPPRPRAFLVLRKEKVLQNDHSTYREIPTLKISEGPDTLESLDLSHFTEIPASQGPQPWYQFDFSVSQQLLTVRYECPSAQGPASQNRFAEYEPVMAIHIRSLYLTFQNPLILFRVRNTLLEYNLRVSTHQEPPKQPGHRSPQLGMGRSGAASPTLPSQYIARPLSSQSQLRYSPSPLHASAHAPVQRPASSQSYMGHGSSQMLPPPFKNVLRAGSPAQNGRSQSPAGSSRGVMHGSIVKPRSRPSTHGSTRTSQVAGHRTSANSAAPRMKAPSFEPIPEALEQEPRTSISQPSVTESTQSETQFLEPLMSQPCEDNLDSQLTEGHDASQLDHDLAVDSPTGSSLTHRSDSATRDLPRSASRTSGVRARPPRSRKNPYQSSIATGSSRNRRREDSVLAFQVTKKVSKTNEEQADSAGLEPTVDIQVTKKVSVAKGVQAQSTALDHTVDLPVIRKDSVAKGTQTGLTAFGGMVDKGTQCSEDVRYAAIVYQVPVLAELIMRDLEDKIEREDDSMMPISDSKGLVESFKLFEACIEACK